MARTLEELEARGLTDVAVHVAGTVIPSSRFVLYTRSGFFERLFEDFPTQEKDVGGRWVVRVPFPFPTDRVRRALEWLHAPEASMPTRLVPLDLYVDTHQVFDYLDVTVATEIPQDASYDLKLALIRQMIGADDPDRQMLADATELHALGTTKTGRLSSGDAAALDEWLAFADEAADARPPDGRPANPELERLVKHRLVGVMHRALCREGFWDRAVATQTAERHRLLRLAFPRVAIGSMAAARGGDRFPPTAENDPAHAMVEKAIADGRLPASRVATVSGDGMVVLALALQRQTRVQYVRCLVDLQREKYVSLRVASSRYAGGPVEITLKESGSRYKTYSYSHISPFLVYCSWSGFRQSDYLGIPAPADPENHFVIVVHQGGWTAPDRRRV